MILFPKLNRWSANDLNMIELKMQNVCFDSCAFLFWSPEHLTSLSLNAQWQLREANCILI